MVNRIRKAMEQRDQGFTLIELLVVVIIIGILAAIAIPAFLNQRKKAVDSGVKADLKSVATLAETYTTDNPSAANFGATPAAIQTNFTALGVKLTEGNVVTVKGGPSAGFCLAGHNTAGTSTTGSQFWYDSANGGLKSGAPSAAPAGGACDGSATGMTAVVAPTAP